VTGRALDRLRLLASALAARDVEVAASDPGEPAWTDGTTIYIDATADPAAQVQALVVQASLLAAGSLGAVTLRQLRRRRSAIPRYLAIEGHRALARNEAVLPPALRSLVDGEVASSVVDSAASLTVALGGAAVADAPAVFGTIRPREVLASLEQGGAGTGADPSAPEAAAGAPATLADDPDEAGDDPRDLGQLLSSPIGGGGPVGRLLQKLFGQSRKRGGGGPAGADAPTRIGRGGGGAQHAVVLHPGAAAAAPAGAVARAKDLTYPEWNVHRHRYRADWCQVVESEAATDAPPIAMPDGVELRRSLGRLGMGLDRCRRRPQGDDIDIDAAVEARVQAQAGSSPDEALYIESLRLRRELSVVILLDVSGSAAEPGPAGRSVHEHQLDAAATLATALHDLGDRVALYAFNSQGRSSVRVMCVKAFTDGLDRRVAQRLGGLQPGAYTRLGAAIRHGTSIVEERGGTSRRLLVVLSDGFAYDHGYEGRYGEADARRALVEARRRGVGCLCVSVGAGVEAAALRRVFGTAAHASVPSARQLPRTIGPLFRSALRSADAQRRVFQRTERTKERLELEGTTT
jgi:hypothetical protein